VTPVTVETDVVLSDDRTLHVYDAPPGGGDTRLVVFWHHGTPNIGEPPEPLLPAAARRGIRWVSFDRPGYGGSTPLPGRNIAAVAADAASVADALGIDRFAVMGHSSGSAHALACAALLPGRVPAVVCVSALTPLQAGGLDWYAGMVDSGATRLRAAAAGRAAIEEYLAAEEFNPEEFTPADHAALAGEWSWLGRIAGKAVEGGLAGSVDDELANVAPWGFDPEQVRAPVLFLHGDEDRIAPRAHAEWLAGRCPATELRMRPGDGHISVLAGAEAGLDWLLTQATSGKHPEVA
jgi:pimeloyl-ACP methyl ester carboxylesterase